MKDTEIGSAIRAERRALLRGLRKVRGQLRRRVTVLEHLLGESRGLYIHDRYEGEIDGLRAGIDLLSDMMGAWLRDT